MKTTKTILFFIVILIGVLTCIHPIFPRDQYLQHIGTILLLIPMVADLRKSRMPMSAFIGIALFTLLHIIGARYVYSNVPYKEWSVSLGLVGADFFQDPRNHYDRFVHFSFGVLLFPFLVYLCKERLRQKPLIAILIAWLVIQTGSMIYEMFEWLITVVMSPATADSYNGQQGDMWDAQKDMALALIGSTIAALFYLFKYKLISSKQNRILFRQLEKKMITLQ